MGLRRFLCATVTAVAVVVSLTSVQDVVPVAAAPPAGASKFVQLNPDRIMDTRNGTGVSAGIRARGSSTTMKVTGTGGIPETATAVVLNVTIDQAVGAGFVQVFPTGNGTPGASSNLNVPGPGSTRPNLVTVPVGVGGQLTFFNHAGGHLIADAFGYFTASGATADGRFVQLASPIRTLDTRDARKVPVANPGDVVNCGDFSTWADANRWFWLYSYHGDPAGLDGDNDGIPCVSLPGNPGFPFQPPNLYKIAPKSTFRLPILTTSAPAGGVIPPGATAVVANVTATQSSSAGFVQLYASPNGATPGDHSNLNVAPGEISPNLAIVPIGADGAITIYSQPGVHVIVDVVGYFTGTGAPSSEAGLFVPFGPDRLVESTIGSGAQANHNLAALAGLNTAAVGAMFLNVTLDQAILRGYLQVFPAGLGTPGASSTVNVDFAGGTRANASISGLNNGSITVFNHAGGRYILDASGYFTAG
jgi:hypothetical protein